MPSCLSMMFPSDKCCMLLTCLAKSLTVYRAVGCKMRLGMGLHRHLYPLRPSSLATLQGAAFRGGPVERADADGTDSLLYLRS